MERLYGAVLLQTVKEWQRKPESRPGIREFLRSEWFTEIAEALDLKPEIIRAKLEAGDLQNVSLRAAYR